MLSSSFRQTCLSLNRNRSVNTTSFRRPLAIRAMADKTVVIKQKVEKEPVAVFSKTYCPYCTKVKNLLSSLNVPFALTELDQTSDGDEVQAALQSITGSRTVPQVFVGGKFIGGCDDTHALHKSGKLKEALQQVNITI